MSIAPMLPMTCPEPFDDERYLFEPKLYGRRLIVSFNRQVATLYNRFGHDVTRQYPELCRVPLRQPADIVLDGEAVYVNPETGLMEPETVTERFRLNKGASIREASLERPLHYFAFDLLSINGKEITDWPLEERKRLLAKLLAGNDYFHPLPYLEAAGTQAYKLAAAMKLDGIVAKRKDSVYASGPSGEWLSVPRYDYIDAVVTGYRKHGFGWLLAAQDEPIGLLETPVGNENSRLFAQAAQNARAGEDRNYVYLDPRPGVRIRHRGITRDGLIRDAEFVEFTGVLSSPNKPAAVS